MSHMVKVQDFQITSLSALQAACRRLNFRIESSNTARFWGGEASGYQFAISVPGTEWQIGVREIASGAGKKAYALEADFFGSEGQKVETAVQKLRQYYAVELTKEVYRRRGLSVAEKRQADGSIRLVVTGRF